jgi:glycosyltransferase involved in cell wall biosynthesis
MRRIGIDVRYLSHGLVGGVHTYVRHVVPELIRLASDREIVLYADAKAVFELGELPAHVQLRTLPWRGPLSTIQNDLLLRRQMERDCLDVVHFPANYGLGPAGVPTVLTVHDAINLLPLAEIIRGHPKTPGTIAKMTYLHLWTRLSTSRAALVLTVSRHAAREIARYGPVSFTNVVPIPHGLTPDLQVAVEPSTLDEVRRRFGLGQRFILADALKNPATVIRAWRGLPATLRQRVEVVFFARRPDVARPVLEALASGAVRLLVRPSRSELIALYRLADVFMFPSWIEGFGLPVLEAMSSGVPVIASNRGAIPEVTGDAALLADADDVKTFAHHLERVLDDTSEAARLRKLGVERAATFSWERTARETLAQYETVSRDPRLATHGPAGSWRRVGRQLGRV